MRWRWWVEEEVVVIVAVAARRLKGAERVQRRAQQVMPLSEREGMLDRDRRRRGARAALAAATADAGRDGAAARPDLLAASTALLFQNGLLLLRLVLREAPRL